LPGISTVVLYDGRGREARTAGSTWGPGVDAHVRDLAASSDHAGLQRVSLLGYYHSASTAIAFAARRPELVDRLVLFGGAPRLRDAMRPAQTQALLSLIDQDWEPVRRCGRDRVLGWTRRRRPVDRRGVRTATTGPIARAWFDAAEGIDVTDELGRVRAPTIGPASPGRQPDPGRGLAAARRRPAGRAPRRAARLERRTLFLEDRPTTCG
jgi:pimeloyl-ACP methyl ester carboxylesterase